MNGEDNLTKRERRMLRRKEKEQVREKLGQTRLVKKISLWGVSFFGIGVLVFGLVQLGAQTGGPEQTAALVNAFSSSDHAKGNTEAKVTLVEYSDFQCPACGFYYPTVKKITEEYGDRVGFAYRHFPLRQAHKNANLAAQAAEAAGRQGKFWEMHDAIFDHQREWSDARDARERFAGYASSLGLDAAQFSNDIDLQEVQGKVEADFQSGLAAGVNATPTFFLNGAKMLQPNGYDDFKRQIDAALGNS